MRNKNYVIGLLVVIIFGLAIWVGVLLNNSLNQDSANTVTDFDSCVKANNIIIETYPRQCRDKDGNTYTEVIDEDIIPPVAEFSSLKGVKIRINTESLSGQLSSPLTITGEVPGNWSFEASFPAILTNWDGLIIAQQPASLQGDWMTEDHVPFSVTLTFDAPTVYKTGVLILQKDNPSGLSENDDSVEIPINYK